MGRPSNRDLATRSPGIAGYPARIALVQRGELDSSRRRLELGPICVDPICILGLRYSTATRYSEFILLDPRAERIIGGIIESMNDVHYTHTQMMWMESVIVTGSPGI